MKTLLSLVACLIVPMAKADESKEWDLARSEMLATYEKIDSFDVAYSSHSYGKDALAGGYLARRVAGNRAGDWHHLNSHGADSFSAEDDIRRVESVVAGTDWRLFEPINRFYFGGKIEPDAMLPDSLIFDDFILATGIWIAEKRPAYRLPSHPVAMRDVCRSDEYAVTGGREKVGPDDCFVVEHKNGSDRIWIGFRDRVPIVARRMHLDPKTSAPVVVYEFEDIRVIGGLPIPHVIRAKFSASKKGDSVRQRETVYRVEHARINDVEPSLFEITPVPGELHFQFNSGIGPRQTTPGGLEHLTELANWTRRMGLELQPKPTGLPWKKVLAFALIAFVVGDGLRRLVGVKKYNQFT